MPGRPAVAVEPIRSEDIDAVAKYLNAQLNDRVPVADWARVIGEDWHRVAPNHGFLLRSGDRVVGACLAIYSTRVIDGVDEGICNLGALCVDEDFRVHVVRLLRSVLKQDGWTFTDLSPSGNVIALNERLGFQYLDTATAVVPGLPIPHIRRRIRVITDPEQIESRLEGAARTILREHRNAAAAHHVLLTCGEDQCYLIYRRTSRKRLPVFASILYVSDQAAFARLADGLPGHLLRHGVLASFAELRIVGTTPPRSTHLKQPRPKMYKSTHLGPENIDYLYSELTSLAW